MRRRSSGSSITGGTCRNDTKLITLVLEHRAPPGSQRLVDVRIHTSRRDVTHQVRGGAVHRIDEQRGEQTAAILFGRILILGRRREDRHALPQLGHRLVAGISATPEWQLSRMTIVFIAFERFAIASNSVSDSPSSPRRHSLVHRYPPMASM